MALNSFNGSNAAYLLGPVKIRFLHPVSIRERATFLEGTGTVNQVDIVDIVAFGRECRKRL